MLQNDVSRAIRNQLTNAFRDSRPRSFRKPGGPGETRHTELHTILVAALEYMSILPALGLGCQCGHAANLFDSNSASVWRVNSRTRRWRCSLR
jgi:hypothetical protein